jgi:integrase
MTQRPKTLSLPPFRAVPKRYSEAQGWYWQIVYQGRKGETAWSGYGTEEAIASVLAELRVGLDRPEGGVVIKTVADLLEYWVGSSVELRGETGALAKSSVTSYTQWARTLKRHLGSVDLLALDQRILDQYDLDRVREGGDKARNTIFQERVALKAAWRWGQSRNVCPNRALPRTTIKKRESDRHIPTRKEVALVLDAMGECWQREALRLQFATGARIGEIVSLRVQDVDLDAGIVRIWKSKTGKREVPLAPVAVRALRQWITSTGRGQAEPGRTLFLDEPPTHPAAWCRDRILRACEATGVTSWTTHGLRYRAVMDMMDAGIDPKTVSEITGHSVETMLGVYRKVTGHSKRAAIHLARLGYLPEGEDVIQFPKEK